MAAELAASQHRRRQPALGELDHLGRAAGFWERAAASLPIRAVVISRLLVFVVGAVGVLAVSKRSGVDYITHLGAIGQLFGGSTDRWDSGYYLAIAAHGYGDPQSLAFFPLYPGLIRLIGYVTGSQPAAGVIISVVSFTAALVFLQRLTELELGRRAADCTVLLLAFAPLSLFFSAVYTESLFLLLSVGSMYAARRERWALAGILGGLATITRVTGIALVLPLLIMLLRSRRRLDRQLGWVLVLPATLGAYLASQALSGRALTAPLHAEATWHRISAGPIGAIAMATGHAVRAAQAILSGSAAIYDPTSQGPFTPAAESIFLLFVLVFAVLVLVACWRRLPVEYGAYAALTLILVISSPQTGQPLVSLDRYLLTIFPLWMVAGAWVAERHLVRPAVAVSALSLVFYTIWFAAYAFIA